LAVDQTAVGAFDRRALAIQDKIPWSAAQGTSQALPDEHDERGEGTNDSEWNDYTAANGLQASPELPSLSGRQTDRSEHQPQGKEFAQIQEPDAEKQLLPSNAIAQ